MNTKRITKNTAVAVAVLVGSHFFAVGMHRVESFVGEQATIAKANAISLTAETLGLEKKIEVDSLTVEQIAEREALRAQLNPAIIRAVMHVESRGKQYAESPVGAIGLLQIMPANAKRCGLAHWSKLYEPEANVRCGVRILSEEMKTYNDVFKALVAYNGGPRAVKTALPESVRYAQNVLNRAATDIR